MVSAILIAEREEQIEPGANTTEPGLFSLGPGPKGPRTSNFSWTNLGQVSQSPKLLARSLGRASPRMANIPRRPRGPTSPSSDQKIRSPRPIHLGTTAGHRRSPRSISRSPGDKPWDPGRPRPETSRSRDLRSKKWIPKKQQSPGQTHPGTPQESISSPARGLHQVEPPPPGGSNTQCTSSAKYFKMPRNGILKHNRCCMAFSRHHASCITTSRRTSSRWSHTILWD